jgi:hypothetical protein
MYVGVMWCYVVLCGVMYVGAMYVCLLVHVLTALLKSSAFKIGSLNSELSYVHTVEVLLYIN